MQDIYICRLDALDDPGAKGFEVTLADGATVAGFVVRLGRRLYAYMDACPHTGVSLAWTPDRYFDPEGQYLQCAMHGALFVPDTGLCVRGPCVGSSLTLLHVELRGERIYLHPGDPRP